MAHGKKVRLTRVLLILTTSSFLVLDRREEVGFEIVSVAVSLPYHVGVIRALASETIQNCWLINFR